MKCDNRMCIYQKFYECTCSDEIEIDWHGLCKNMLPARITANTLTESKFYSRAILNHNTYHFDKETGEYICDDEDFAGSYEE